MGTKDFLKASGEEKPTFCTLITCTKASHSTTTNQELKVDFKGAAVVAQRRISVDKESITYTERRRAEVDATRHL